MQGLANVTSKQLIIDWERAQKVNTLKDISLFASYSFPKSGEFSGGLIARSLNGVGKEMKKTKRQLQVISGRTEPIEGATGAYTKDRLLPGDAMSSSSSETDDSYTVRLLQQASDPLLTPELQSLSECDPHAAKRPESSFALKQSGSRRTVFNIAQKEIMIAFYNRQAQQTGSIRERPEEARKVMVDSGLEPLTDTQIRGFWSTYHRKRRQAIQNAEEQVTNNAAAPTTSQLPPNVTAPTTTIHSSHATASTTTQSLRVTATTTQSSHGTTSTTTQPSLVTATTTQSSHGTAPTTTQPSHVTATTTQSSHSTASTNTQPSRVTASPTTNTQLPPNSSSVAHPSRHSSPHKHHAPWCQRAAFPKSAEPVEY